MCCSERERERERDGPALFHTLKKTLTPSPPTCSRHWRRRSRRGTLYFLNVYSAYTCSAFVIHTMAAVMGATQLGNTLHFIKNRQSSNACSLRPLYGLKTRRVNEPPHSFDSHHAYCDESRLRAESPRFILLSRGQGLTLA